MWFVETAGGLGDYIRVLLLGLCLTATGGRDLQGENENKLVNSTNFLAGFLLKN